MVKADQCSAVGPGCPVEASIYGYYPDLGANAAFIAIFTISGCVHVFQGLHYKTPWFMWMLIFGCFGEAVGYGGRIMLHDNPFSGPGFKVQAGLIPNPTVANLSHSNSFKSSCSHCALPLSVPVSMCCCKDCKSRLPLRDDPRLIATESTSLENSTLVYLPKPTLGFSSAAICCPSFSRVLAVVSAQ
jgi:hypothetical protein